MTLPPPGAPPPDDPLPDRGLTAAELAVVLPELDAELRGAEIADAALLDGVDDLILFVTTEAGRRALHVVPGGRRARVCVTGRRFPKAAFASGPRPDRIAGLFRGARIAGFELAAGDRRFAIGFEGTDRALALHVELFGNRGLWALCDAASAEILALSRLPDVAGRTLRPGARYEPPAPRGPIRADPPPRFTAPGAVAAVDRAFTALDVDAAAAQDRSEVERALARELARRGHRAAGLERQRAAMDDAGTLRRDADLLLAYGAAVPRAAPELRVPDPADPDREVVIARDTTVPPHVQAQALYKKARKFEDGRAMADRQLAEARAAVAELEPLRTVLEEPDGVARVRAELERLGVLRSRAPSKPDAAEQRVRKVTGGENFRRFESAEGLLILVGRDNRQNDRLSTRIARGNDLWLHVGRGYAGSHVVVRVPKGRTASLETLLDAATLAIHFSKVRGAALEEVIYTQAKNVRKAKGLPPGKVLAAQTRSIRVRLEPERLARLLAASEPSDPPTR